MTTTTSLAPVIVIVEDDATIAAVEREVLIDEGYQALNVAAPTAETIAELHPAFVLLDLVHNGVATGLDLLRTLKANPITHAIPTLVVTGLSGPQLENLADQLTAWDCTVLAKPFDLDDLIAHVRDCLSQTSP